MKNKKNRERGKAKGRPPGSAGKIRVKRTKAIIEAAQIEFSKIGFSGTSLQSIADRAGLTYYSSTFSKQIL